ncbi:MAG: baaA1 [Parcubacteria group bacterium]|nr:baaA1 [Parcubacteria group bacterium]
MFTKKHLIPALSFSLVLLISFGVYSHVANAATSIAVSSATLAADGRTLTVHMTGVTGSLSPATAITNFSVAQGGVPVVISTATSSATTVTLVLSGPIVSTATVTVNLASGNLTDTGSDTVITSSGNAVTNSSTVTATTFAFSNAVITQGGQFGAWGNMSGHSMLTSFGAESRIDFEVTGTSATMQYFYASDVGDITVTVANADGSGATTVTPTLPTGALTSNVSLFSGKPDATYRVSVVFHGQGVFLFDGTSFLSVTGSAPALSAYPGYSGNSIYPFSDPSVTPHIVIEPGFKALTAQGYAAYNALMPITGDQVQADAAYRFKGSISSLYLWAYGDGANVHLDVYDATGATLQNSYDVSQVASSWGTWMPVASGMDTSTQHIYRLTGSTNAGFLTYSIMTVGGTGLDLTWTPPSLASLSVIAGYGDSITAGNVGTNGMSWLGYIRSVAQKLPGAGGGAAIANFGLGGDPVIGSGDTRFTDITGLSPQPKTVFVLYGINDINAGVSTTTFAASYSTMVNGLSAGLPSGTNIDYMAVLPTSYGGGSETKIDPFNAVIASIVTAKGGHNHFINTKNWNLGGTAYLTGGALDNTNFYDGLHPNPAGYVVMTKYLTPFAVTNPYSVSGPSSGANGTASANFTVTLNNGAAFDANDTVVLSDGASGGTFTPSVGSLGTSIATVTPALNATSFTFTYTPATSGTKTLTFTNGQGWVNPGTASYLSGTVTPPAISAISVGSIATTSATVAWTTDVLGSSRVSYGPTSTYSASTTQTDTSPRVMSHSVALANLVSCSTYHYQVDSIGASSNEATSSDQTFTTTCPGSVAITSSTAAPITTGAGGTLVFGSTSVTVPTSYTGTTTSATFAAQQLDPTSFFAAASRPVGMSSVGGYVVDLKAFVTATTTLSTFTHPISVILTYNPSDVAHIDISSLLIYRYDVGTGWTALTGCVTDTGAHTVTCQTSNFSDFSLFGTATASTPIATGLTSSTSGRTSGGVTYGCKDTNATNYNAFSGSNPALCVYANGSGSAQSGSTASSVFTRDLTLKSSGSDVTALQTLLIAKGYLAAGNTTGYFGAMTQTALMQMQAAVGISPSTGYFGAKTRAAVGGTTVSASVNTTAVATAPTGTTAPVSGSFTRDLTIASTGADVSALQAFLNANGYAVAQTGPGSSGHETTMFGFATQAALARFQTADGIVPATGYFGAKTRAAISGK